MSVRYYVSKLVIALKEFCSFKRIQKYGILIAIYNFIIFICHRNNSKIQLWAERKKDLIVQKYLYKNYYYIIERYKTK